MVWSLCVVRKMFPYKNMSIEYVRPCRTRQYASPSIRVICRPGREMYPSTSHGSIRVAVGLLLVQGTRSRMNSFETDCSFRANGSLEAIGLLSI